MSSGLLISRGRRPRDAFQELQYFTSRDSTLRGGQNRHRLPQNHEPMHTHAHTHTNTRTHKTMPTPSPAWSKLKPHVFISKKTATSRTSASSIYSWACLICCPSMLSSQTTHFGKGQRGLQHSANVVTQIAADESPMACTLYGWLR